MVLSLWGEHALLASALEGREGDAVLQAAGVRVSDYSGCSLNSAKRSIVIIDPPGAACKVGERRHT